MKKKLYALSGVFMIVLVISGLWATKAINLTDVGQTEPAPTQLAAGMTMQQMVERATMVVIGKCVGTRTQWVDSRRLYTVVTISVAETLKGNQAKEVTVAVPGGIAADRKFKIAVTHVDAPTMVPDEEVALFLVPEQDEIADSYSVVGNSAGKFSIAQNNDGQKVVTRDMTRARVQTGGGMTRGNPLAIPIEVFRAKVMSYLQ